MALEIMTPKHKNTAVLLIAPETGRLSEDMGPFSRFISGKSGGLGDVISALCDGLTNRGIDCHLATLNLKSRFQQECSINETEWHEACHTIDSERIHLINSSVFENLSCAYGGNPLLNAAEFQKALINDLIVRLRANYGGNLIIHSHDWMAGGIVTAYAKAWDCPVLHTLHNVHTGHIPTDMYFGVNTERIAGHLYMSDSFGRPTVDCQATAIKNADLVSFVGRRFLREILGNQFTDRSIIPASVRQELYAKYEHDAIITILNAPARSMYPERCTTLARCYGPEDDVIRAKRENLMEFQKRTGLTVDPGAILLYWPSRLDPSQKGIDLLEAIAHRFVIEHPDVQIAIVGNGVGNDRTHEEICGRIACSSGGKIAYQRYSEPLSMLGFAAASDVFGASLYEPCGQIDQVGNLFGATATNRDTGGYHDKIKELSFEGKGGASDRGNGFLFRDYDTGGLWYGLDRAVQFHRLPAAIRERQIKRIMRETRYLHDMDVMIDKYVAAYERLNGGVPLASRPYRIRPTREETFHPLRRRDDPIYALPLRQKPAAALSLLS